jgi:hypothetical protein
MATSPGKPWALVREGLRPMSGTRLPGRLSLLTLPRRGYGPSPRYDFDEVRLADSGRVSYRCEACEGLIETR